jgi:hypothetical protein
MAETPKTGIDSEFEHSLIAAIYEASPDGILAARRALAAVCHGAGAD